MDWITLNVSDGYATFKTEAGDTVSLFGEGTERKSVTVVDRKVSYHSDVQPQWLAPFWQIFEQRNTTFRPFVLDTSGSPAML